MSASYRARVLVAIPYYLPGFRGGGPIRTISAMVEEYGDRHEFLILTRDRDWKAREPMPVPIERWTDVGRAQVWYRPPGVVAYLRAVRQARILAADVLYLNGVFPLWDSVALLAAHRLGLLPARWVVVAPRGELGRGALQLKARRKRARLAVARTLGLHRLVVWHASTPLEAAEVRAVDPRADVVVLENETALPRLARRQAPRPHDGPLRVVFLSRVAEKKGVHVLLEALDRVAPALEVDIYGPEEDEKYGRRCGDLARGAPTRHRVAFRGPVPPERVGEIFARSDVFAFPTANENFGHAIAESLCAGCPVLAPDVTPWSAALRDGGGGVVPSRDPADWAEALTALASRPASDRPQLREAAADAYDRWAASRPSTSIVDILERRDAAGR